MSDLKIHILNTLCPELTLCGFPSNCANYKWGRVVIDEDTCSKCVAAFIAGNEAGGAQ